MANKNSNQKPSSGIKEPIFTIELEKEDEKDSSKIL